MVRVLRRGTLIAALLGASLTAGAAMAASESPAPSTAAPIPAAPALPLSATGSYLAGRHAQQTDDWSAAADFMAEALSHDPGNPALLRRTYLLQLGNGRTEEAIRLARRLAEIDPTGHLAVTLLVADDILARRYAEAERRLSGNGGDDGLGQFVEPLELGWIRQAQGDGEGALKALEPLASAQGFAALHDLHAGLIAERSGRDAEAADWYAKTLAGGSPPLRVVQIVGSFYERTGRTDQARALYDEFRTANPDSLLIEPALTRMEKGGGEAPAIVSDSRQGMAEALFNVASALHQEGATELALLYGRIALYLRPDLPLARIMVGDILSQRDRPEDALEEYRAAGGDAGLQWTTRLRIAERLEKLERTDEAVKLLETMGAERPERTDALIQLGDLYRTSKRFDEAIKAYGAALDRVGDKAEQRHWLVFYSRGVAYERTGHWDEAEKDLSRALELSPEQPFVLNYLGYSWVDRGLNLEKAKAMVERAVELRPTDGYIVDSLGWALYRLGDYAGAVTQMERAVELKPLDATINDHLGDVYWQVGREVEAQYQWQRALQNSDEEDLSATIRHKLEHGLPRRQTAATAPAVR
jgi:tetratricopeptide (TPR) repeat protein